MPHASSIICVIKATATLSVERVFVRVVPLKIQTTSRVIEPRIEARSANLVGETKVDGGDLWSLPMCAGANVPGRTKSPLMAFATANHHDSFVTFRPA